MLIPTYLGPCLCPAGLPCRLKSHGPELLCPWPVVCCLGGEEERDLWGNLMAGGVAGAGIWMLCDRNGIVAERIEGREEDGRGEEERNFLGAAVVSSIMYM